MNRLFPISLTLITILTACAPVTPAPTSTPFATETATPAPTLAQTSTPVPVNETLTPSDLEKGQWGEYAFTKSGKGDYYEVSKAGVNLPEIKLYKDGTALLSYKGEVTGKVYKDLVVPFQVITQKDGNLMVGLWEYKDGQWNFKTGSAPKTAEEAEAFRSLAVVRGHKKEDEMINTIFTARDIAMRETPGYDPKSEFEGISVTVNFHTIDNFDVRPKGWEIANFARSDPGLFMIYAKTSNKEVDWSGNSRLNYARPMQVALGGGWFGIKLINEDGSVQEPALHTPIVAMNPNRQLVFLSSVIRTAHIKRISHLLTKEARGDILPMLTKNPLKKISQSLVDSQIFELMTDVNNKNFFDILGYPGLDGGTWELQNLPPQLNKTFLKIAYYRD